MYTHFVFLCLEQFYDSPICILFHYGLTEVAQIGEISFFILSLACLKLHESSVILCVCDNATQE